MNIKFVVIGLLIIAGLWFGNEKYMEKKFQDNVRQELKSIKIDVEMEKLMKNLKLPLEIDILNHYPKITIYYDLGLSIPAEHKSALAAAMKKELVQQPCYFMTSHPKLKNDTQSNDYYHAFKKVLSEDQVTMTIIVRDKMKQNIADETQELSKCSVFLNPPKK